MTFSDLNHDCEVTAFFEVKHLGPESQLVLCQIWEQAFDFEQACLCRL